MAKVQFGYPPALVEQGILTKYVQGFEADRRHLRGHGRDRRGRARAAAPRSRGRAGGTPGDGLHHGHRARHAGCGVAHARREPRAGVSLLKAARAAALLDGREFVVPDDVKLLAPAVLRHRINVAPELELEGVTADVALKAILDRTEVPTA